MRVLNKDIEKQKVEELFDDVFKRKKTYQRLVVGTNPKTLFQLINGKECYPASVISLSNVKYIAAESPLGEEFSKTREKYYEMLFANTFNPNCPEVNLAVCAGNVTIDGNFKLEDFISSSGLKFENQTDLIKTAKEITLAKNQIIDGKEKKYSEINNHKEKIKEIKELKILNDLITDGYVQVSKYSVKNGDGAYIYYINYRIKDKIRLLAGESKDAQKNKKAFEEKYGKKIYNYLKDVDKSFKKYKTLDYNFLMPGQSTVIKIGEKSYTVKVKEEKIMKYTDLDGIPSEFQINAVSLYSDEDLKKPMHTVYQMLPNSSMVSVDMIVKCKEFAKSKDIKWNNLLVNCRGGVDRTGKFIILSTILDQLESAVKQGYSSIKLNNLKKIVANNQKLLEQQSTPTFGEKMNEIFEKGHKSKNEKKIKAFQKGFQAFFEKSKSAA